MSVRVNKLKSGSEDTFCSMDDHVEVASILAGFICSVEDAKSRNHDTVATVRQRRRRWCDPTADSFKFLVL